MASIDDQYRLAEVELERHLEDAEVSKLAHFFAAGQYEKRHKFWIGVPATCAGIILTWLLTAPFEKLVPVAAASFLRGGLPIIFSLATSILTAIGYFLNYGDLANRHRFAAHRYQEIFRLCKNWRTDFPDVQCAHDACLLARQVRERLNQINHESPQIPAWSWKSVDRQKAAGSTTYEIESGKASDRVVAKRATNDH